MDKAILFELIDHVNVFTKDDGIAVEIHEELPLGWVRVRVFKLTAVPGFAPEESIREVLMSLDESIFGEAKAITVKAMAIENMLGCSLHEGPLVRIVLDEESDDKVCVSLSAAAVAAILLHHP